ncbi:hypothetical protein ACFLYF_05260 [Chloroflexota bacterium]
MDWWQIGLIILAAVVVGLLVGGLVSFLITRIRQRPEKSEPDIASGEQPQTDKTNPIKLFFKNRFAHKTETPTAAAELPLSPPPEPPIQQTPPRKEATPEKVSGKPALTAPGLFEEIESNRRIANNTLPATGNLSPFETSMWDASRDGVHTLPDGLRDDIAQAYVDMRLANSITWLSVELGRRSPNLDESYSKLCDNIAARLNRISPQLKHN